MIGNSGDNTNFSHELFLINRQVANLGKGFAKNASTDIKLSKTQLSKMIQSNNTTLIISNDEMDDILKIVKSLEDYGVLLKGASEAIQNEA